MFNIFDDLENPMKHNLQSFVQAGLIMVMSLISRGHVRFDSGPSCGSIINMLSNIVLE